MLPPLLLAAHPPDHRPLDLWRMFVGDEPPLFLVEVALRTVIIFLFTLLAMRFLGKRGVAQLSLVEVTIVLGLGSAVGDPMFQADVPLSHSLVVIAVIVVLYRLFTRAVRSSKTFERFMEDQTRCLIRDGVLDTAMMARDRISQEKLFEMLRLAGITQLGEVKRAYMEQSGELSVFAAPPAEVEPGLPIVPPWDVAEPPCLDASQADAPSGQLACRCCGARREHRQGAPLPPCTRCQHPAWTPSRKDPIGEVERAAPAG